MKNLSAMKKNVMKGLKDILDSLNRNSKKQELENLERNFQEKEVPIRVIQRKKRYPTQAKIKRYINKLRYILSYPYRELKTKHQQVLSLNEENISRDPLSRNPYQVFFDWLFEILEYGVMIAFVFNTFVGWMGWYNLALIPAFGLGRLLLFDTIRNIRKK